MSVKTNKIKMATRSRIAVLQKDGSVKSIYCHNDGYTDHVGAMLFSHHNTEEKANELMSLGDISCLYEHLKPLPEAPMAHWWEKGEAPIITTHSFDKPQKGVTVAYHRDRNEPFRNQECLSLQEYNEQGSFESYNYLWQDGKWFIQNNQNTWIELTKEIVDNDIPEEV